MQTHSRVSLMIVGLALVCAAPQCENKKQAEHERAAREAEKARAERERAAREAAEKARAEAEKAQAEAEKGRLAAEKEATVWKTSCVISLVASLAVLALWVFSTAPQVADGATQPQQPDPPLRRRLSVTLLVAGAGQVGGLVGGFLFHEIGAVVASLSGSALALAGLFGSASPPSA